MLCSLLPRCVLLSIREDSGDFLVKTQTLFPITSMTQGRILADAFLYRTSGEGDEPAVLIECSRAMVPELQKMLKLYRLRAKVDWTGRHDAARYPVLLRLYSTLRARVCVCVR